MTTPAWPLERCEPQAVGLSPQRMKVAEALVDRHIDEGRTAGVITLVARRGRIAHLRCAGMMDLEAGRPMTEDAIFRIYSMTKIVTSAAVLMLLEEGHFLLSDPVRRFIPEFADLRVATTGADGAEELVRPRRDVTIADLLTHTAGLPYEVIHQAIDEGWPLEAFVRELCRRPLLGHPGELWRYSAATDVLGYLVQVVSGRPFDAFLRERIFEPLGMVDTDFHVPPEKADRLAWVYTPDESGRLVPEEDRATSRFLRPPSLPSGGGGLCASTCDYLRFALMLLGGGALGDVRLLGPKTVELMRSDALPRGHEALGINGCGFGLGVAVLRDLGESRQIGSVGEFGWGGAACTELWIDPAEQMVTMAMMQLRLGVLRPADRFGTLMKPFKNVIYSAIGA